MSRNYKFQFPKGIFIATITSVLFSFSACTKKDFKIKNLNGNEIEVIGHGGMGVKGLTPLNSLKSFEKAIELGADGIELDIQITKDNVFVVFHNKKLEDGSNKEGRVYEKKWSELEDAKFSSATIPQQEVLSLAELLGCLEVSSDLILVFDIKTYRFGLAESTMNAYSKALVALIKEEGIENQVLLEFNDVEFAKSVQQLRPDLKIFVYNEFTYAFEKAIENGFYGITVDMDQVSATDVLKAHENNLRVALFGPDSKSKNIEAIKMQPDYIQSDALKHLDRILN